MRRESHSMDKKKYYMRIKTLKVYFILLSHWSLTEYNRNLNPNFYSQKVKEVKYIKIS